MKKVLASFFCCLPLALLAQVHLYTAQKELINTKIDTLFISDYLLNEPADKNYSFKFKVLEFWATWCKPCLKAVPHLNRLQAKYKDSNIVFLSFTNERPEKAVLAFNKVKFETIVVTDTSRATHKKLRIEFQGTMGLPRTVLIDDQNNIVWYGNPEKLTSRLIDRFLRKEPIIE